MKTRIDTEALMVILLGNGYRRERADLIVRAVNSHEELLDVIKQLKNHLDGCSHGYPDSLWDDAEKVIAKAEGK